MQFNEICLLIRLFLTSMSAFVLVALNTGYSVGGAVSLDTVNLQR